MANWITPTNEQAATWREFVASRPPSVREMCKKWPYYRLYRMATGQRVTIHSYSEDRTVTVNVTRQWNPDTMLLMERRVFGVDPASLTECDLPPTKDDN